MNPQQLVTQLQHHKNATSQEWRFQTHYMQSTIAERCTTVQAAWPALRTCSLCSSSCAGEVELPLLPGAAAAAAGALMLML
jgi:hypothetical protein